MTINSSYTPVVGPALLAVFSIGIWIGWKLTRPGRADAIVDRREYWKRGPSPNYRRNPKTLPVFLGAFAGAFLSFGLRGLAEYLSSLSPAVVAVGVGALCIAIGIGACTFNTIVRSG
jgi:hypothetical protein